MIVIPIVPASRRRRSVQIALALVLVIVVVLLAAGCDEPPNNDIVIVKLTPNATVEWSQIINSGGNDRAFQIIQTPDNSFVLFCELPGQNFRCLVKISDGKNINWKLPMGSGIIRGKNGDIISYDGSDIFRIDAGGTIVRNITTKQDGDTSSILETPDNGYIVGGVKDDIFENGSEIVYDERGKFIGQRPANEMTGRQMPFRQTTVARLDAKGNVIWQTYLGREGSRDPARMIVHLDDNQGYMVLAGEKIIRLDEDGIYMRITDLDAVPEYDTLSSAQKNLTPSITYLPYFIFYNSQGMAVAKQTLKRLNVTIAGSTNDGGYIAAGFPGTTRLLWDQPIRERGQNGTLHVVKLRSDGSIDRDTAVQDPVVNSVSQIMQTSDGGYVLVCGNDKRLK